MIEELIEYIFVLESEVDFLREELRKEKKKMSDKINKDYEDNRNMVANIFKEVVKNDPKRKTTNDRR
mgnify:FL=1|jgi:hypothetical protein